MAGEGRYDVVVVGAGIAGLSAACRLARGGLRVVLLEGEERAGGLCRTIRDEGMAWDLSLYGLRGAAPEGPLTDLFHELGIAGDLRLQHAPRACEVRIEGEAFPIGNDRGEMLAAAERLVRGGADSLRAILAAIDAFNPARDYPSMSRAPFSEVASGLAEPLLAAFSAPLLLGLGLSPQRASAWFAFLKYRLLLSGVARPEGGAESLVRALESRFLADGGAFVPGARVDSVDVRPDGSQAVSAGNRSWRGDALVLAVDATTALGWLANRLPPRIGGKAALLAPSMSATVLLCTAPGSVLTAAGLGRAPQAIILGTRDLPGYHDRLRAGELPVPERIAGFASPAAWNGPIGDAMQPLTAFLLSPSVVAGRDEPQVDPLDRLRDVMGQEARAIRVVSAWTPRDFEARTGNRGGSFCGWEMGPERYGRGRIAQKLPLPGVWLAGHWTDPGPSVLNAALSGRAAARGILGLV